MADLRSRVADALGSSHRIIRELGGGGMSSVFLAEEIALGRQVVVKVLPPELSSSVNAERFQREVRTVAGLQHPHIVPLISAGGAGDLLWFTMPYVEGESLRSRVSAGALPVGDAIRLWGDMLDALAYAHGRGVIHRDIKPENVLLSGRHALIADFGVAKALDSATGAMMQTGTGLAIGTPAYMAPEQIAADPNADHRVDIYAAGLVMYEMLLGRGPFADRTPAQQMAAHATTPPPALRAQRQELPEALETLVMQCLAKDPSVRPQGAQEALTTLQSLGTVTSGGSAPISRKRTGLKVAAAIVLVALAGASFALPRFRGTSGPTIIADSAKVDVMLLPAIHEPADSLLAQGAMETFRSTLADEPRIFAADLRNGVPTPAAMLPTNGTITRDSILRWIPDLGVRAHLTLSIARAGTGFVISTVVKAAATDSTLLNAQDAAKSGVEVPRIVAEHAESAKRALASRFGTLERPEPNGRFWLTTPTAVQALNDGSRSAQSGDAASATSFLRAAVRADSNFALGWYVLHSHFSSLGIRADERLRAIAAAYRHRDQARILALRLEIEARYLRAQGDDSAAAAVLERMERELGDVGAGPTLAAIFVSQRRFEDALRRYANARDTTYIQPSAPNAFYIFTLLDLKREDEARAEYARLEAGTGPNHPNTRAARFAFWRYHRQTDSVAFYAEKEIQGARDGFARNFANGQLVNALPTLGRLREWEETITRREQRFNDIDAAPNAVSAQLDRAMTIMFLTQDTARAGALVDEALQRAPLEKMAPMDRPYGEVIQTLGAIGRIAEARRYSAEADREIPPEFRRAFSRNLAGARVELEIAAGDAAAAMREARLADVGPCAECRAIDYARAFDIQGNVDSALVYYDRFLDAKSIRLAFWDATFRANALRRAGALREQQGDIPGALARYREFVELWRNADPALQPQVREVEGRITRLQGRVG